MNKPIEVTESNQRRGHLEITVGKSVSSRPAIMPWVNDARESIVSMSRRLTTLIIKSSANGGFKNGIIKPV